MEDYFYELETRNLLQDVIDASPTNLAAHLAAALTQPDAEFRANTVYRNEGWRASDGPRRWWNSRFPSMRSWE